MTKADWQDWRSENHGDFGALIDFANDNELYCLEDVISTDSVDDFIRARLDNGGWQGVACCISDISDHLSDDYYEIDGYGNLTVCEDWDTYADYVEDEMEFDSTTCDNCYDEYEDEELKDVEDWVAVKKDELGITEEELGRLEEHYSEVICINCFNEILEQIRNELNN